jgi:hypothetical protein
MKKKILLILAMLIALNIQTNAQVKVNFVLQNPRYVTSTEFWVDIIANVPSGQIWRVGPTNIRMNVESVPTGSFNLIPANPFNNANVNISGNNNYENMSSTSILSSNGLSVNILLAYNKPAYYFTTGSYTLGSLKFAQTQTNACLNLSFISTSSIFDSLTQLTSNQWGFTNPAPCINVSVNSIGTEVPKSFNLYQNYPNPFNPVTNIKFSLPKQSYVTIKVYDNLGKEVANLINDTKPAGLYLIDFDASYLPSGIYYYKMTTNEFTDVKKMILIK